MSHTRDYLEQNMDTIDADWQKEMVEVNEKRERLGLPPKIFSEEERGTFEKKWLEDRSI